MHFIITSLPKERTVSSMLTGVVLLMKGADLKHISACNASGAVQNAIGDEKRHPTT